MTIHAGPSRQDYATPWHIVRALEDEHLRRFQLDVCADATNAKAAAFLTVEDDGLKAPWAAFNWCNPPYSDQPAWLQRAAWHAEVHGCITACLVRAAVDTRYWFRLVATRATCDLFCGRIAFIDATTGAAKAGTTFASALVWYGPGLSAGVVRWRDARTGALLDVRRAAAMRGLEVSA